jgi:hypothetical protein
MRVVFSIDDIHTDRRPRLPIIQPIKYLLMRSNIKKLLWISVPLLVLSVAAAYFFVAVPRHQASSSDIPIAAPVSDPAVEALQKQIDDASGSDQFERLAHEVINTIPAEHMQRLLQFLLDRWIEQDLSAALDFVARSEKREMLLPYVLTEAGYLDFRGVLNWIGSQPEPVRQELNELLYTGVGQENPDYALEFIDLLDDGEGKERIMRLLLEQWAPRDIDAVLAWINSQTLPPRLADLKASLVSLQNLQEAGDIIRNMQPGHEKNTMTRNHAELLARTNIQAAAGWARSLDDPDAYGIALTAVYQTWLSIEPDKQLIMEQALAESDGELRDHLINEIASHVASKDPADLAAMIDRLPPSSQQDVAEKVVLYWKERDLRQTLDWVRNQAPGPVRDRASRFMVDDLLLKDDRKGALSLATMIGNQSMRFESVKKVVAHWYMTNPAEAQQTLNGISFLSEAEKEMISLHVQQMR